MTLSLLKVMVSLMQPFKPAIDWLIDTELFGKFKYNSCPICIMAVTIPFFTSLFRCVLPIFYVHCILIYMKNLRYHFPTCYAYSVKEPIGELNLKRTLDEDTGVFSSFFSLLSSSSPLGHSDPGSPLSFSLS